MGDSIEMRQGDALLGAAAECLAKAGDALMRNETPTAEDAQAASALALTAIGMYLRELVRRTGDAR